MEAVLRLLRGWIRVTVEGAQPHILLNRCAEIGLRFRNAAPVRDFRLSFDINRHDLTKLRRLAEKCGCSVVETREHGLPKAARPLKKRYVFLIFAVLTSAALLWSSLHVWEIRIMGSSTVPDGEILSALDECGVAIGSYWPDFSSDLIRCGVLLRVPELSWLAVNVRGSSAEVIVREATAKPDIRDEDAPTDVISSSAGIITDIRTYAGETVAVKNQTVEKGQLLVSGAVTSSFSPTRFLHAYADVYARTWHELTVTAPLDSTEYGDILSTTVRYALIFGNNRINFYGNSGIVGVNCGKITEEYPLAVAGVFTLPITLVRETVTECECVTVRADRRQLREKLEALLIERMSAALGDDGEIVTRSFTAHESGGYLTVTLRAECTENIARESAISVQQIQDNSG